MDDAGTAYFSERPRLVLSVRLRTASLGTFFPISSPSRRSELRNNCESAMGRNQTLRQTEYVQTGLQHHR